MGTYTIDKRNKPNRHNTPRRAAKALECGQDALVDDSEATATDAPHQPNYQRLVPVQQRFLTPMVLGLGIFAVRTLALSLGCILHPSL